MSMDIGINIHSLRYSSVNIFMDRFQTATPWSVLATKQPYAGRTDPDGYPIDVPAGGVSAAFSTDAKEVRAVNDWVLTWKGNGKLGLDLGYSTVLVSPNKMTFKTNPAYPTSSVKILESDPTNPVCDINVVRADQVDLFAQGKIFRPEKVDVVRGLKVLRFMEDLQTNGMNNVMTSVTNYTWGTNQPIPLEIAIGFANEAGAQAYLNLPVQADEAYLDAYMLKARAAKFPVICELGNEVWNPGLSNGIQTAYATQQGKKLWPSLTNDMQAAMTWYGYRTGQIAKKFRGSGIQIGLGAGNSRAKWVADGMALSGATFADCTYWITAAYLTGGLPVVRPPDTVMTTRMGRYITNQDIAGAIEDLLHLPTDRSVDYQRVKYAEYGGFARQFGLKLLAYEGGYELGALPGFNDRKPEFVAFVDSVLKDPRIKQVTEANFAAFEAAGGVMFLPFYLYGGPSEFGNFDWYNTPSWEVLQARIKANSAETKYRALAAEVAAMQTRVTALGDVRADLSSLMGRIAADAVS